MTGRKRFNRRELLGASVVVPLGLLAARSGVAAPCTETPRQTSGPFFPASDQLDKDVDLTRMVGHDAAAHGQVIRVTGRVLDGSCNPIEGALVDLWQADHYGRYRHPADPNPARPDPNFQGWGQAVTDAQGRYSFRTIKPAAYPLRFMDGTADAAAGYRTPHIHFRVSKRGHDELSTQMYFAGEKLNDTDAVLARVPERQRQKVVIVANGAGGAAPRFEFDIVIVAAA